VNIKADDIAFMGDKVILLFKCPRCRQHKEINGFGVRILKNVHSRQSHCKKCRSEQSRES
jgi:hypothetical protein